MREMWSYEVALNGNTRFLLLDGDPKWDDSEFVYPPWRADDGALVVADSKQDLVDWLGKALPDAVLDESDPDDPEADQARLDFDAALREADVKYTPVEAVLDGDLLISVWNLLDDVLRTGGHPFNFRGPIADKCYDKLFYSLNMEWMLENAPPGYRYVPIWPMKERRKIYQVISTGIARFRPLLESAFNISKP